MHINSRGFLLFGLVGFLCGLIVAWVTWEDVPTAQGAALPMAATSTDVPSRAEKIAEPKSIGESTLALEEMAQFPAGEMDLQAARVVDGKYTQVLGDDRSLVFTLDPVVQQRAESLLHKYKVDYGAVVAIEPHSGRILARVSSSIVEPTATDLTERANPPAASVFKVITTAALLESIGLQPNHVTCFHGGRRGIWNVHLLDNPKRDHICQTLTEALGRSSNVIYGKLATRHLDVDLLSQYAHSFGWDRAIPSTPPIQPSRTEFDQGRLEFARGAAGFYHTHMSPTHGAMIAATVANGGKMMAPSLVERYIVQGRPFYKHRPHVLWRSINESTAKTLAQMMVFTTESGTSSSYFRKRNASLRGVRVAAKTGSLSADADDGGRHHFSWWIGFAPADDPQIAVATMIVSIGDWRIKSSHVAREVLEAYFKAHPVSPDGAVPREAIGK